MALAHWAVNCNGCHKPFAHSEVADQHTIDYFLPMKPQLPQDGQELECPHCKSKARYLAADLWYQETR